MLRNNSVCDIDGDGRTELIARSSDPEYEGINVWNWESENSGWVRVELDWGLNPHFTDANGWNKPEYYETIQFADIDGDGRAELIARGRFGINVWKYQKSAWIHL